MTSASLLLPLLASCQKDPAPHDSLPPSADSPVPADSSPAQDSQLPPADSPSSGDSERPPPDTDAAKDSQAPTVPEPENLVINPGFEEGESGWNIWGGAERAESPLHEGSWVLQAQAVSGAEQVIEGLEPGMTYRLSAWGMSQDGSAISLGVKEHGFPETHVSFTSSSYQEQTMDFTVGFGSTSAKIYLYKHSGEGLGFGDSVSLVSTGSSPYTLVWADEFDGEGPPDSSRWGFEEGFVRNEELQWYQEDNAYQEGGYLVIEGREEDRANPNYDPSSSSWQAQRERIEYSSSSLRTQGKASWQFGRIVVRAQVTNHTGTWPAIWTVGDECPWPSNGEIDIMENYGGQILANFAWGSDTAWSAVWDSSRTSVESLGAGWTDEFHIWELDWTEDAMAIYLDGVLLNDIDLSTVSNGSADCAGENPFHQPHSLILNLALGSNGGSVEGLSFPTRYLVDYARVYQLP